ncbi:MAG: DUF4149 domain-containing protein [Gallionella sp.]|jgi:hypothetical protein|nr:DUF4149 domain-containing protein [Gallionella sp.]
MNDSRFFSFAIMVASLWVGGLWIGGYLAVPVLFGAQSDRQLAGMLAGEIFSRMGLLDMLCAAYLLIFTWIGVCEKLLKRRLFVTLLTMLFFLLLIDFGLQPAMSQLKQDALPMDVMRSPLASQFSLLHGISSLLYLSESLLGLWLLWSLSAGVEGNARQKC